MMQQQNKQNYQPFQRKWVNNIAKSGLRVDVYDPQQHCWVPVATSAMPGSLPTR